MAEKKQRFPGVVGPAYTLDSERFDCQELINYYIEIDELGAGKGQEPAALMPVPGLEFLQTIGAGPIRCTYTQSNDELTYVVSGNEIYQIAGSLGLPITVVGNLLTSTGFVDAIDNGISVVFVDGQYGYYTDIGSLVLNQIVSANFYPTDTISYQDGYFIGTAKDTQAFFTSDINAVTWPPLNLNNVQGSPDTLVASKSLNRQLYNFGTKSNEPYFDSGESVASPFVRQDGRMSQQGCASAATIQILNEQLVWLSSNSQGGGTVYMYDGSPAKISTLAVERTLQEAGTLNRATAFSYQQHGHYFYCLNVPGLAFTWVYDLTSKMWHKRQDNINGIAQRCIAQTHAYLNEDHIVGDYRNGNIYRYNTEVYTNNNLPVYRIRQFPHSSDNLNYNFYKLLQIDFQMGVGLPDDGSQQLGYDPRVACYISKDGGKTFGLPRYRSLGKMGKYNNRVRFGPFGSSTDLVVKIVVSEPVRVVMLSGYLDWEGGTA